MFEKRFFPRPVGPDRFRGLASVHTYSEDYLQTCWSDPGLLAPLGRDAIDNGDVEFARRCMERVVDIDPTFSNAWFWLGVIEQDPQKAVDCYERAIQIAEDKTAIIQRSYQQRLLDEGEQVQYSSDIDTFLQKRLIQQAKEGASFEKKRMGLSPDSHWAVVRVRQRSPKAVNTWSNGEDESGKIVRRFRGWVHLVGFAGTHWYKVRLQDGFECFTKYDKAFIDIISRDEPFDKRNLSVDDELVDREFDERIRGFLLSGSPEEAMKLMIVHASELREDEWRKALWYERAGDLAHLINNIDNANELWTKAATMGSRRAKDKLSYRQARSPQAISSDIIKAHAEEYISNAILPCLKPEFYLNSPWGNKPTDIQRLYTNEIAEAFKAELENWESKNGILLLDFAISRTKPVERQLFFGFLGTEFCATENVYMPATDVEWNMHFEWYKNAENKVRRSHGLPLRGAHIRETLLFEVVKQVLEGMVVVRQEEAWQYLPWLRPQHVDIFIPPLNLGIEYQGEQHFEPVDHFGGQEGYQSGVERDQRKRDLFAKHGVALIFVLPQDPISPDAVRHMLEPFLQNRPGASRKIT